MNWNAILLAAKQTISMQPARVMHELEKGAESWNAWRKANKDLAISLDGRVLRQLDLSRTDLSKVSFRKCTFENCDLQATDLIAANFSGAKLHNCNLTGAKLIAACLNKATFVSCTLTRTNLLTATTRDAKFIDIDLRGQDISGFDLRGIDLTGCNLEGLDLQKLDFTHANLYKANLRNANLNSALFIGTNLSEVELEGVSLKGTCFRSADLSKVNLQGKKLVGVDLEGANLSDCDLRGANLCNANLTNAKLNGAKLWRVQTQQWEIAGIECNYVYWDKGSKEKTVYKPHEFERIFSEAITIELSYPYRLTAIELSTLPIFSEHLAASHWGIILRLKSISEVAGGALVRFVVEETGCHKPSTLKYKLQAEADRIHSAQLAMRNDQRLQAELKEKIAAVKEEFWPRLLELAADHERQQVRNLTVVFMDLKGFSIWRDDELAEKLSLFRGLVKPILKKWHASYPNMEGDSLRITFKNASAGLACACMLRDVLTAAGFEVRIGVELGEVAIVHNEVTDISDLEGTAVSMAARIEAIAEPGEVLVTDKIRHYTDHKNLFLYSPKQAKLKKSIGTKKEGDIVECYSVTTAVPLQEIG